MLLCIFLHCRYVCVCVCVCVCVHTKGPFLLMECFIVFSQILITAMNHPPPYSYNDHHHIHMQLPPPHSASGWKELTTSVSCNGWQHHWCKECLCQWLKEKHHQCKLQPVTTAMCASGVLGDRRITPQAQGAKVRAQDAQVWTVGAKARTSISASQ